MPDGAHLDQADRAPARPSGTTRPARATGSYGPITVRGPGLRPQGGPLEDAVLELLRRQPLFHGMDDALVEQLLWSSRVESFGAGEHIYERGQPARHFFVVVDGRVNLSLCSRGGDVKVLEILRPGQVLGEAAMFMTGGGYPVTAIAATSARLLRIGNRDYLNLLRECPETCLRMIGHLTQRLDRHIHQIEYMTLESATHRLSRVLEGRLPAGGAEPAELELAESRQELASFLSMKPETLSRALRALSASGVIDVRGRSLRVLDRAALRRHAEAAD